MPPTLNLYIAPGSCALASHILLHASGLPFTTTTIDVFKGFPASHLHLNPKGKVPILQIDDDVITETPAIFTAISQLAPDKQLLGKSTIDVVRAYEWIAWLCGTLHGQAFGCLFRPGRFVDDESMFNEVKRKGRKTVDECFRTIDEKLEGKTYAVGDAFTAVDAYLLVFYRWGNRVGFGMKENYPNYTRVVRGVGEVASVKEAIETEAIPMFND